MTMQPYIPRWTDVLCDFRHTVDSQSHSKFVTQLYAALTNETIEELTIDWDFSGQLYAHLREKGYPVWKPQGTHQFIVRLRTPNLHHIVNQFQH